MERAGAPGGTIAIEQQLPLDAATGSLPVLWWLPTGRPVTGVVWLQHGYARNPRYLNSLATALAADGLVVAMPTVPSFRRSRSINDLRFIDAIGGALTRIADDGGALRRVAADVGVQLDGDAASRLVLVAHSAGCAVVARAARRATEDGASFGGVVLLDATDNLTKAFTTSLDGLSGVVVRAVFAQPSWCNRKGQGAKALLGARDGYVGIRLTSGSHCDAEGHDTDRVCATVCGRPDPANVDLLFEATTAWARDLARGRPTPAWEPGGGRLEAEAATGRVEVLHALRRPRG